MDYNNRTFRGRTNSASGEVGGETLFHYYQEGDRLTGTYSGGTVVQGHLIGNVLPDGRLEFLYHHVNTSGELMAGKCNSVPSEDAHGKLVLQEEWQWLTGDRSSGQSEVEEI